MYMVGLNVYQCSTNRIGNIYNWGELCIVRKRCLDNAFVIFCRNHLYAIVFPLGYRSLYKIIPGMIPPNAYLQ